MSRVNMLELESRPEILKPEQNQNSQHGQNDERGSEDLVGAGGGFHDQVFVQGSVQNSSVDILLFL
jgi:hypothetical protein